MKAPAHGQTVTVKEAARELGIPSRSLYRYIERGDFPCIRIGRHIRVARRELDARIRRGIVLAKGA